MSKSPNDFSGSPHPAQDPVAEVSEQKPEDVFNAELSAAMVKRTDKLNDNTIELALRLKQAREFMAWSSSHLRGVWLDWMDEAKKASQDMNLFRMSFERETKTITAAGKDLKDFFNSPEYMTAHARLTEMVAMMDRFKELKQNGTLDAFADFILKVSCNNHSNT